ncbi:MAG: 4Fe-4S binding protein, partial [Pseudomonadota bacterium]
MFVWLRRAYQLFFLGLFLFLVVVTAPSLLRGYPVDWFLDVDPLVAVSTALSTRSLHHHLLWAVPLIALTLVFGRFFCGWICPMGVLHQAVSFLARKRRKLDRARQNKSRRSRRVKYLVLAAMLGMAALGSVQTGLLDPIASTWRALAVSIVPAMSNTAFGLYQGERHFHFGVLVVAVFVAALVLNLVYTRFYCRALCPLGALLGVLAKLSVFRIHKKPGSCKDCDICSADCQGGADPQGTVLVTECMLCLNCIRTCPRQAISYGFLPASHLTSTTTELGRRRWLTAALAGVV